MNTDQLESFVKYAASKGLDATVYLYPYGDWCCSFRLEAFPESMWRHSSPDLAESIRVALDKLSTCEGAPPEPAIWWRTLQIRQQIEQAEDTDMHMDFALTFELVRLGLRGLPELRGLIADTLRSVLQKTWTSDTEADLADALAAEDLPAFVNHVDGLLAWASTHGNAEQALGEALRGVP